MGDALEAAVDAELDAWESRTLQQQTGLVGARAAVRELQAHARRLTRHARAPARRLLTARQRQTAAWIAALSDEDHLRAFVDAVGRRSLESFTEEQVLAEMVQARNVLPAALRAGGLFAPELLPAEAAATLTEGKRWLAELLTYLWVSEQNRQGVAPTSSALFAEYRQHLLGHGRTAAVVAHEARVVTPHHRTQWVRHWRERWECTFGRLQVHADLTEDDMRPKAGRV